MTSDLAISEVSAQVGEKDPIDEEGSNVTNFFIKKIHFCRGRSGRVVTLTGYEVRNNFLFRN